MFRLVADELSRTPDRLLIDLSEVTSVEDAGVEALALAAELAGEADISFGLVGARTGPVAVALDEALLSELFDIYRSLDEA
jgi:anti-anti-sigma regulatory factor